MVNITPVSVGHAELGKKLPWLIGNVHDLLAMAHHHVGQVIWKWWVFLTKRRCLMNWTTCIPELKLEGHLQAHAIMYWLVIKHVSKFLSLHMPCE